MMRCKTLLPAALALMFFTLPNRGLAQTPPPASYTENGFTPQLLDTALPRAERMKLFANMVALANSGQVRAQDLAGTLLWLGPKVAGSPVPVNLDLARKLLANAAINGDVTAMAKLAELELAAGRPPQAMVWAQLYARYLDPLALQRQPRGRKAAYASNLIGRIQKAGGHIDDTTRTRVAAMVSRFDQRIRRGFDAMAAQRRSGKVYLTTGPMGVDPLDMLNRNGIAEYMMAFDSSGAPQRIWNLDAFPDPAMASELRHYLDHVRANTAHAGSGLRFLRVTIVHEARRGRILRPVH